MLAQLVEEQESGPLDAERMMDGATAVAAPRSRAAEENGGGGGGARMLKGMFSAVVAVGTFGGAVGNTLIGRPASWSSSPPPLARQRSSCHLRRNMMVRA